VDFNSYSDCAVEIAVGLVNDPPETASALGAFLREHGMSGVGRVTAGDVAALRALRERLLAVFTATDVGAAAHELNALLEESAARPQLVEHDGDPWHLHYTPASASLADRVTAPSAMALAVILRDDGLERFRTCSAETCNDVFVDTSRNRSRRYCSAATCANRANVAAYRRRQRAGS
jgi:predicted RNA-binding Zn ribbon-like protein